MTKRDSLTRLLGDIYGISKEYFDYLDLIHLKGKASQALMFHGLFNPELVNYKGAVLLKWNTNMGDFEQRFASYLKKTNFNISDVEKSFNFTEVPYLFAGENRDLSDEGDHFLANVLAVSWRSWLCAKYPNHKFEVEILNESESGSVVSITFYQVDV